MSVGDSASDTAASTGDIADACEPFVDALGGEPVTVTLENARPDPIFAGFPVQCSLAAFEMLDAAGQPVQWRADGCTNTCEDVLSGRCSSCGPCAPGVVVHRLEPGGSLEVAWSGVRFELLEISSACVSGPCDSSCERSTPLPPGGEYTLRAVASSQCTSAEPGTCECSPAEVDGCTVFPDGVSGERFESTAILTVGEASTVSLVFE